jgi:hypothetical protein
MNILCWCRRARAGKFGEFTLELSGVKVPVDQAEVPA